jgi:hypothetical protein
MSQFFASPSRRIGAGLVILAWTTLQFLLVARTLDFVSRLGLGIQVGIAAAVVYSGIARMRQSHS